MNLARLNSAVLLAVAFAAAGCEIQRKSETSAFALEPSSTIPSLLGTWSTQSSAGSAGVPAAAGGTQSCSNFVWNVTSQSATHIVGNFTAVCLGSANISGTGTGNINGDLVTITITGNGSMPGLASCPFSLSGNGTIEGDVIRVPYTGTTCLGPVSGTQTIARSLVPWGDWRQCGSTPGEDIVECVHAIVKPARTEEGAFEVTKRVAWLLRGSGGGLLIKRTGENIVHWKGEIFAAGRICYPDGKIYKLLTDIPSTNGPSWQDNGYVDRSLYVPAIAPD